MVSKFKIDTEVVSLRIPELDQQQSIDSIRIDKKLKTKYMIALRMWCADKLNIRRTGINDSHHIYLHLKHEAVIIILMLLDSFLLNYSLNQ